MILPEVVTVQGTACNIQSGQKLWNPLRDIGLVEKESTPRDVSGLVLLPKMDVLDGEMLYFLERWDFHVL